MRCQNCQTDTPPQAAFCFNCGVRLGYNCRRCGQFNLRAAESCEGCGIPFELATVQTHDEPPFDRDPSLNRADAAVGRGREFAGERKLVTVMFVDTKGSLEMIAGRDPEAARQILSDPIEIAKDAIHRFGGTVTQVQGDGLMALFGAPIAQEDHAVRACLAALATQRYMRERASDISRRTAVNLQLRIGLSTGEVVFHATQNDLSVNYVAVGEAVHVAARMEQLAPPEGILITDATFRLASTAISVKRLGPTHIKGLPEPLVIYELLHAKASQPFLADRTPSLTPFINRRVELGLCMSVLSQVTSKGGQILAVYGEPGCGKSRLMYECIASHQAKEFLLFEGRAHSYGARETYLPIAQMLRDHFHLLGDDDAQSRRRKITEILGADGELRETIPGLLAIFDDPLPEPSWSFLEPSERRKRIQNAVCTYFIILSRRQPLIILIEDLQWLDGESMRIVQLLIEAIEGMRAVLQFTSRPEFVWHWQPRPFIHRTELKPLHEKDAALLVRALIGRTAEVESVGRLLIERTEGNPFFMEESVRALVDDNVLVREGNVCRLSQPLTGIHLPATVRAALTSRIDRLPYEDKEVLEAASVIGRHVHFALLRELTHLSERRLGTIVDRLTAANMLYESRQFPDRVYSFRHALTHEAVYASLLRQRRRELHVQVVGALSTVFGDSSGEHVELFAYHSLQGSLWRQSMSYARQAGAKAAARSANRDAVSLYEQALAAARHLPKERDVLSSTIDIYFALRDPLFRLGELSSVASHLKAAEELIHEVGDAKRRGQLCIFRSHIAWLAGTYDTAMAAANEASQIAALSADHALDARAAFQRGLCRLSKCEFALAVTDMQETYSVIEDTSLRDTYGLDPALGVVALSYQARALAELGEFVEAARVMIEARRLAESIDKPFSYIFSFLGEGYVADRIGNFDLAIQSFEVGLEKSNAAEAPLMYVPAATFLGMAYSHAGRAEEAVELLRKAVEVADSMEFMCQQPLRLGYLAEGLMAVGHIKLAKATVERACSLAISQCERGAEAFAEYLLGSIVAKLEPENVEEAQRHYDRAIGLATELSMRPLLATIQFKYGEFLATAGIDDVAVQKLTIAVDLFRSMGMPSQIAATERLLHRVANAN